jgi:hypothetical protein
MTCEIGIRTFPPDNNASHIPKVLYVIIGWFVWLINAKSMPGNDKKTRLIIH